MFPLCLSLTCNMNVKTLYPARDSTKFRCAVRNPGVPPLPNFNSKCFRKLVSLGARDFTAWMDGASVTASINAVVVDVAITPNGRNHNGNPESPYIFANARVICSARSSWRQLSPALMITGFNAHPGRFPYGEAARTRSTLSSHFSPKPPALRFQGEGTWDAATAAREDAPPALRGRNGDPGAGAEVASLASAAGAHVALAPPPPR
mmetsp:Transcript_6745/g.25457  ORF Transcript_6745/g.25457 Transcript_6745/m.25457 type:complete len:206 (+) Transcript_6745:481-1098(+)